jgi:hypothetical protein
MYTEFAVPSLCTQAAIALPPASTDSDWLYVVAVSESRVICGPQLFVARV